MTLLAVFAPLEFAAVAAITFMARTLQEEHGCAPGQVTVLYVAGGALAIVGNVRAGSSSGMLPALVIPLLVARARDLRTRARADRAGALIAHRAHG